MSISTSSNHSESRTPPPPIVEGEDPIHNQLSSIAHALLTRQPVRVHQLMALHNDKEVIIYVTVVKVWRYCKH